MRYALITVLAFLSACGGPQKPKTEIQFWQFWSDPNTKPVIEKLASEFEAENPGVKINITDLTWANGHDKLVISFAAGQAPDIMELGSDWIAEFSSRGLLADFKSDLPKNYLEPAVWQDTLHALPWLLASRLLYFNLELLKEIGAEMPSDWDDLLEICDRIDSLSDNVFGFGCNSAEKHRLYKKFLPFLWSNSGQVLDDSGQSSMLNTPEAIEALDYYLDLCDCGVIESQRRLEEYFIDGNIGFIISGGWLLKRLRVSPPDFQYQLAEFMTPTGEPGLSFFGGEYLAVSSKSDNIEMAKKFAEFLTTRANSQRLCDAAGFGFPPYPDLVVDDPEKKIEADQLLHSRSTPPTPLWVDIEADLEDAIEAAMYKHGTPKEILEKASETIDSKLKSGLNAKR